MASENLVNIGSGNGLLPDGTKPLPKPMLTDHQWDLVTSSFGAISQDILKISVLNMSSKIINSRMLLHSGANELTIK